MSAKYIKKKNIKKLKYADIAKKLT